MAIYSTEISQFPWCVELNQLTPLEHVLRARIWCDAILVSSWKTNNYKWYFSNHEEAVLFELTWG